MDATKHEYLEVNLTVLMQIRGYLPLDIFIKRTNTAYTKVFKKGDMLDADRIRKYSEEKGVSQFSVKREDYGHYQSLVGEIAKSFFENANNKSIEEISSMIREVADLAMLEFVSNKMLDQHSVDLATNTIKGCVLSLKKDVNGLLILMKHISKQPYHFKHSLVAAVFSILIAKKDSIEGQKNLEIIGLGALLHDIGMSRISFNTEEKSDLNAEEWREIKTHPELGKRLVDNVDGMPDEVKLIIGQHHEQPNGNGYPNHLYKNEIYYPAKIVTIADTFTALILPRPYRKKVYNQKEAIELLLYDRGRFDQNMVNALGEILFNKDFNKIKKSGVV